MMKKSEVRKDGRGKKRLGSKRCSEQEELYLELSTKCASMHKLGAHLPQETRTLYGRNAPTRPEVLTGSQASGMTSSLPTHAWKMYGKSSTHVQPSGQRFQ